jgi:Predicted nucleotide-binding protein containing TIR-like domain
MKRKLFIGSSGGRGVSIAQDVASQINAACSEWLECDIWDRGDVFAINRSFLDSLLRAAQRYHYGIFVATKDDPTEKKGVSIIEARDNVIFEMGLFLGSMGISRSFLLVEKGVGLPSDFDGITMPRFSIDDQESAKKAVAELVQAICRTRKSFNLKPIPSAALALGYFDNFLKPFATKYWERYDGPAKVKVILPNRLISYKEKGDFTGLIRFYESVHPSDDESIFKPGERPVIKKLKGQPVFWDIPTTLFTLKQLFDKLPSMGELIGGDEQKAEWLLSEMNEFGRSLAELKDETFDFQRGISLEISLLEIQDGKASETPLQTL